MKFKSIFIDFYHNGDVHKTTDTHMTKNTDLIKMNKFCAKYSLDGANI